MANTEEKAKQLTIIHFNDVYSIEPTMHKGKPVGGAARFATKVKELAKKEPLVLFSGDALGPSRISNIGKTNGEHMIPILNTLGVQAAVFGNHEFDYGVEHLVNTIKPMCSEFPWLMSNVKDKKTERPLGEGLIKHIITWKWRKIGLIGLIEYEWLETLLHVSPGDVDYTDFVKSAQELVPQLTDEGCELVIALTHMHIKNDVTLASVPSINLILGGHDHIYKVEEVNNTKIVHSGFDFRDFSEITIEFTSDGPSCTIERHTITPDIVEDEEIAAVVTKHTSELENIFREVLGHIDCDLDGKDVRTKETNLGNFIADVACRATRVDCVVLNSGLLRSGAVHQAGNFTKGDLCSILCFTDLQLVEMSITGKDLLKTLEIGVSGYPDPAGRFPLVSKIKFMFDPSLPQNKRIIEGSVYIDGESLQLDKTYKLGTNEYLCAGKDGYNILKSQRKVRDGPILFNAVEKLFTDVANQEVSFENCLKNIFDESSIQVGPLKIKPKVEGRICIKTVETSCGGDNSVPP